MVSCECCGCVKKGTERVECCHVALCDDHFEELVKSESCCVPDCKNSMEMCHICMKINGYYHCKGWKHSFCPDHNNYLYACSCDDTRCLKKIISGGQTGADRAGLEAAKELGLETGGTAPPNFFTTKGKDPMLGSVFGLKQMKSTGVLARDLTERTKKNVDDSDATIAFRLYESPGTDKTIGYCKTGRWTSKTDSLTLHRPVLIITSLSEKKKGRNIERIQKFIKKNNVKILNVAGHRASDEFPSLEHDIKDLLICAFRR